VGLRCSGTLPMALGAVGIARAGMVSVPLDPTAPPARVRLVLDDVGSALLLSDGALHEDIGRLVADPCQLRAEPPPGGVERRQGRLASVVFTSGSTGVPKGIMVPLQHRTGLPTKLSHLADVEEGALIGALAAGTVGFAETIVHTTVQLGATLNAYEIRRLGVNPLADWLARSRVAGFATVPTIVRLLVASLPPDAVFDHLRLVILTGETATWEDVTALRRHLPEGAAVCNLFGLTETSTITVFRVDGSLRPAEGPLPAGKPVPTCRVSIVDEDGRPVPAGERGEIVVSGEGCTLGYWGRPELTERVFTFLPDGTRQVRTGDAGRFSEEGLLEHLGRLDHLVKIAGNRVELGEVEAVLRALDGVFDAAAAAYTDTSGATRLAAFVVTEPGVTLDGPVLRLLLARRLPGPMLPDQVLVVDELPQLANGKVDRRLLSDRAGEPSPPTGPGEMTDLERAVWGLWAVVLDRDDFGLDDDFFDLGGDSLRAARLFADMDRSLGIDRPIALILEAPTVRSLAAAVAAGESGLGLLVPVQVQGSLPPLFVVHDGVGDVFYATRIAASLGPDRPVYAIQPALALGGGGAEATMEQLASRYLRDVRRLRPHGPYFLYGFSLGGVIAFEMALQLQSAQEEVGLLGLGDSAAPAMPFSRRFASRAQEVVDLPPGERSQRLAVLSSNLVGLALGTARQRLSERPLSEQRLSKRQGLSKRPPPGPPPDATEEGREPWEERGMRVVSTYGAMMYRYRPTRKYTGTLLLVRAGGPGVRPDRGWRNVASGQIVIRDVDCDHNDLGKAPHAQMVANALSEVLDLVGARWPGGLASHRCGGAGPGGSLSREPAVVP
ncbi:MAG: AMP-binding protein, partial [Acidimicrobiales bacterium]